MSEFKDFYSTKVYQAVETPMSEIPDPFKVMKNGKLNELWNHCVILEFVSCNRMRTTQRCLNFKMKTNDISSLIIHGPSSIYIYSLFFPPIKWKI